MHLIYEIVGLILECKNKTAKGIRLCDLMVFALGGVYEYLYLAFAKNILIADRDISIYYAYAHTPVYTDTLPTMQVL